jgi:two-component system cell cycle sensor histidine kinase/response regulator CckA
MNHRRSETSMTSNSSRKLRARAEELLRQNVDDIYDLGKMQVKELVEELRIHQIQLEMQNENLLRSQFELEEAREQYFDLYDNAPVGYIISDGLGNISSVNRKLAEMLETTKAELLKRGFTPFVTQDDTDFFYLHCRETIQAEKGHTSEIALTLSEDRTVCFRFDSVLLNPMLSDELKIIRTTISDLSEQKRAEAALRDREQRLELILASTGEGMYGMDLTGQFTFANRASVKMLGYGDEQELLGQDVHTLIHHTRADGTVHAKEDCPIYQARSENKMVHLDDELLWRADGSSFRVDYRSHPMLRDGEVVGTVVSFSDITERKEKEAQLRQAQKMEVVGQLTGGIAHDFNNLLTVILANLGLLRDEIVGDAGAGSRELINDALSAARDGAALTDRLLAFSRKQSLQVQRVEVGEFLSHISRFLQRMLREDIELRIERAHGTSPVLVDPGQFESALLNLVVNARDAMPEGGTVVIETTRKCIGADEPSADPELAPGNYIMITVGDSGIGMSPADAARAIEPFFTTKQRGKGSGLGLSMVYGFAKQSGGGLLLRSVLGEGTTVSMLLPEAAPANENEDAEPTPRNLLGGSETILLVEDESQVRKVAKQILLGLGYQVIEVENAAGARKVFQEQAAVDLLFSDIVMRGDMNGRELARWASQRYKGLNVLLTTGFSEEETGELRVKDDGFHLLRKPYSKAELAAAVRAVLDGGAVSSLRR